MVETANDTCTGIDSVFVEFFGDFLGNSSSDTSICFGESTFISATGGSSYSWSPITNLLRYHTFNDTSEQSNSKSF